MFKKPQSNKPGDASPVDAEFALSIPLETNSGKRGLSSLSVLDSHKPSVISEGFSLTGDIFSSGILHIEGKVNGKIKADSINIGPSGQVDGELSCETLHIKGMFSGSAVCGELVVADKASIRGSVTYRSVTISRGAVIEGELLCKR
jgi:cytoskeletal protein CcmA (bactofilin family)